MSQLILGPPCLPAAVQRRWPRRRTLLKSWIAAMRMRLPSWMPAECTVQPWQNNTSPALPVNSNGCTFALM